MKAVYILALLAALVPQSFHRITEAEAHQALNTAIASTKGADANATIAAFLKAVKPIAPDYETNGVPIIEADSIFVAIAGPLRLFQYAAAESLRRFESPDKLPWAPGITIGVSVRQITAPDIVNIVVTRNGTRVEPIENRLVIGERTTAMGAKNKVHEGQIVFPAAAFDPGGDVIVTLIPENGKNVTKKLTDRDLRKLH